MSSNKPSTIYPNGIKPNIGDIATSKEVNRTGRAIHIWEACPECKKERWVKRNASGHLCKSCALRQHSYGKNNRRWNDSRKIVTKSGVRIYIEKDNPYFCMAHKCSLGHAILEHRLVMAEYLNRPLKVGEIVHHIDGNNLNNDITNLQLLPNQAIHSAYTMIQTRMYRLEEEVKTLQSRITILEAENELLRSQVEYKDVVIPN